MAYEAVSLSSLGLDANVTGVEMSDGGLFIQFDDGQSAFYSGFLLHASLGLAAVLESREELQAELRK
jgi:hypothetical protein